MAKLVVMYRKPEDPKHFEKFYREVHIPLVEKMPGIKDYSYGYPTGPDGEEGAFFCFFIVTFYNVEAIKQGFASPAGKDVMADIPKITIRPCCFSSRSTASRRTSKGVVPTPAPTIPVILQNGTHRETRKSPGTDKFVRTEPNSLSSRCLCPAAASLGCGQAGQGVSIARRSCRRPRVERRTYRRLSARADRSAGPRRSAHTSGR